MKETWFQVCAGILIVAGGCQSTELPEVVPQQTAQQSVTVDPANIFIGEYLEIDQKVAGSLQADDANLFTGDDHSPDHSPSYQVPAGPPGSTYVDWDNL